MIYSSIHRRNLSLLLQEEFCTSSLHVFHLHKRTLIALLYETNNSQYRQLLNNYLGTYATQFD